MQKEKLNFVLSKMVTKDFVHNFFIKGVFHEKFLLKNCYQILNQEVCNHVIRKNCLDLLSYSERGLIILLKRDDNETITGYSMKNVSWNRNFWWRRMTKNC